MAITRARHHLFIVGHSRNLSNYIIWKYITVQAYKTPKSYYPNISAFNRVIELMHGNQQYCQLIHANNKFKLDDNIHDNRIDVMDDGESELFDRIDTNNDLWLEDIVHTTEQQANESIATHTNSSSDDENASISSSQYYKVYSDDDKPIADIHTGIEQLN